MVGTYRTGVFAGKVPPLLGDLYTTHSSYTRQNIRHLCAAKYRCIIEVCMRNLFRSGKPSSCRFLGFGRDLAELTEQGRSTAGSCLVDPPAALYHSHDKTYNRELPGALRLEEDSAVQEGLDDTLATRYALTLPLNCKSPP